MTDRNYFSESIDKISQSTAAAAVIACSNNNIYTQGAFFPAEFTLHSQDQPESSTAYAKLPGHSFMNYHEKGGTALDDYSVTRPNYCNFQCPPNSNPYSYRTNYLTSQRVCEENLPRRHGLNTYQFSTNCYDRTDFLNGVYTGSTLRNSSNYNAVETPEEQELFESESNYDNACIQQARYACKTCVPCNYRIDNRPVYNLKKSPDRPELFQMRCVSQHRGSISYRARKNKRKGRRDRVSFSASPSSPLSSNEVDRVFIWNLEDTILSFNTHLIGQNNRYGVMDLEYCNSLALKMDEILKWVADINLFGADLKEVDQMNVDDMLPEDNSHDLNLNHYNFYGDGFRSIDDTSTNKTMSSPNDVYSLQRVALRYRRIKEIYIKNRFNVEELVLPLGPAAPDRWLRLRYEAERITAGWMSLAFQSLAIINSRSNCRNVLVTNTQLVPAITKLLMFGLGGVFNVDNIYSSSKVGRDICFERIVSKFGQRCTYVLIGTGREDEVAKLMVWPFWRVSEHADLFSLQHALQLEYL